MADAYGKRRDGCFAEAISKLLGKFWLVLRYRPIAEASHSQQYRGNMRQHEAT
jgi:hypothetical protein